MEQEMHDEILTLLQQRKHKALKALMAEENSADLASALETLKDQGDVTHEELLLLFRLLPKDVASDTFAELSPDMQESLIQGFNDKELQDVMADLFLDDAVDIIEEMPANVVKRMLKNVSADMRATINQLLNYPENSAGSMMTTEFIDLKKHMTVEESFARIRRIAVDKETIYTCYVTDAQRHLLGMVSVKDLLLAKYRDSIDAIMEDNVISVTTSDDQELVAQMFDKYGFIALPVVDSENRLVGIITVDDAIDVMQEEFTEDIEKMNAIVPTDKPYLKMNPFELWKARIPWLLLLMISATFTGTIIRSFENALAAQAVLVAYVPMLMDTGGNSGSQASVTLIRGLSLGEIKFGDWFKVVLKEFSTALLCGATLALANFFKLLWFDRVGLTIALIVAGTMMLTVIVAKLVGCTLPMVSKKIGFDPAVMSAPFITTIVDAISLFVYFTIAANVLNLAV